MDLNRASGLFQWGTRCRLMTWAINHLSISANDFNNFIPFSIPYFEVWCLWRSSFLRAELAQKLLMYQWYSSMLYGMYLPPTTLVTCMMLDLF